MKTMKSSRADRKDREKMLKSLPNPLPLDAIILVSRGIPFHDSIYYYDERKKKIIGDVIYTNSIFEEQPFKYISCFSTLDEVFRVLANTTGYEVSVSLP